MKGGEFIVKGQVFDHIQFRTSIQAHRENFE